MGSGLNLLSALVTPMLCPMLCHHYLAIIVEVPAKNISPSSSLWVKMPHSRPLYIGQGGIRNSVSIRNPCLKGLISKDGRTEGTKY